MACAVRESARTDGRHHPPHTNTRPGGDGRANNRLPFNNYTVRLQRDAGGAVDGQGSRGGTSGKEKDMVEEDERTGHAEKMERRNQRWDDKIAAQYRPELLGYMQSQHELEAAVPSFVGCSITAQCDERAYMYCPKQCSELQQTNTVLTDDKSPPEFVVLWTLYGPWQFQVPRYYCSHCKATFTVPPTAVGCFPSTPDQPNVWYHAPVMELALELQRLAGTTITGKFCFTHALAAGWRMCETECRRLHAPAVASQSPEIYLYSPLRFRACVLLPYAAFCEAVTRCTSREQYPPPVKMSPSQFPAREYERAVQNKFAPSTLGFDAPVRETDPFADCAACAQVDGPLRLNDGKCLLTYQWRAAAPRHSFHQVSSIFVTLLYPLVLMMCTGMSCCMPRDEVLLAFSSVVHNWYLIIPARPDDVHRDGGPPARP